MCVDFIQTDKKDVVEFKLWVRVLSASVRRSTIGYGKVLAPESLQDLTDHTRRWETWGRVGGHGTVHWK